MAGKQPRSLSGSGKLGDAPSLSVLFFGDPYCRAEWGVPWGSHGEDREEAEPVNGGPGMLVLQNARL